MAMAATYALGTFNDNFFKQAVLLLAVAAGMPSMQGYALVIFTAPFLIFAAPAGWLADRFPKRYIVIGAKSLELLAMLAGATGVCYQQWWLIFTMLALMGTQAAIFSPALNGSLPELYPAEYVTRANGVLRLLVTIAILSGVALAGVALDMGKGQALAGVPYGRFVVGMVVIGVAALGLLASFGVPRRAAAAPGVRFPWDGPKRTFSDLWSTRADRLLVATIGADVFIWFAGSLGVLIINPLGKMQYGLSETMTSGLIVAQLVGIAGGGLLAGRFVHGERWYRVMVPAGVGMGVSMLLLAAVPLLPVGAQVPALFALLVLVGVAGGLFLIPAESFIQVRPAADRKGAILAASNFVIFAGILLSGLVSNVLNACLEPTASFGVTGCVALLVCVFLRRGYRAHEG